MMDKRDILMLSTKYKDNTIEVTNKWEKQVLKSQIIIDYNQV